MEERVRLGLWVGAGQWGGRADGGSAIGGAAGRKGGRRKRNWRGSGADGGSAIVILSEAKEPERRFASFASLRMTNRR
jgi:hypothetical protein